MKCRKLVIELTDYEFYVKKYARDHGISEEEAREHCVVKECEKYYGEKEQKKEGRQSES